MFEQTTTTTTTTITGKDGKKHVQVQTIPSEPQTQIQEMPAPVPSSTYLSPSAAEPPVSAESSQAHTPPLPIAPDVPARSPQRVSQDMPYRSQHDNPYSRSREAIDNPVSPIDGQRQNFSYPSRGTLREDGTLSPPPPPPPLQTQQRGSGTLESLKAAAIGLHVSCGSCQCLI